MKIIVSHDVDHLSVRENLPDGLVAKFSLKSGMEFVVGRIGIREFALRCQALRSDVWNGIEPIMDYDEAEGIPSTFFFGMANGLGLSYSMGEAARWIRRVEARGFGSGVHGIAYDDPAAIAVEKDRFAAISSRPYFGIRMHYLRSSPNTSAYLAEAGYAFDATPFRGGNPWLVGAMAVFPLHAMDGRFLQRSLLGLQTANYGDALARTRRAIRKEALAGTTHFSLLFHDRYFTDGFATWKRWYKDVVAFFKSEGHVFASYEESLIDIAKALQGRAFA
jgi:hypothetical protein